MFCSQSIIVFITDQGLRSGSTGVAVLISGESLYVAWLGDSQVVLCKAGQPTQLMSPHKPDREVSTAFLLSICSMFANYKLITFCHMFM